MKTNKTYNFTLILSGVTEPSDELENALYESNCEDALLYFRDRIGYLEFDREARSFAEAILSAIKNIEKAEIDVKPIRVEPSDFVTSAEISRRLDRSRESISQLISGKRGSGTFPHPIAGVTTNTLIWSWAEVVDWFYLNNKVTDYEVVEAAKFIRHCNEALEFRNNFISLESIKSIVAELDDLETIT
jgi:hypothetical protein